MKQFFVRDKSRIARILCLFFAVSMILNGCGAAAGSSSGGEGSAENSGGYQVPDYRGSKFDPEKAEGNSEVQLDLSHKNIGYFALRCSSDARLKLMLIKGDDTYIYDIIQDEDQVFPFQLGNGTYTIKVMKNVVDSKYTELYVRQTDVKLKDEFDPFLRPSQYANYNKESKCVAKAAQLASEATDANDFISSVYKYVCKSIKYDKEKAANIQPGYIPDPDEIYKKGKGICFDYASLAASMLRSQGIPTKIIFGYVGDSGDLYHAWNMYYTKESGWVAVEFEVKADEWNRLDLTFSANGQDSQYIGDGSNYLDAYQY